LLIAGTVKLYYLNMIERDLNRYADKLRGYTELRLQENRNLNINLLNGTLMANAKTSLLGTSVRVYDKGGWGFASAPGTGPDAVSYCLGRAAENAAFLSARRNSEKLDIALPPVRSEHEILTVKPRSTQKEIVDFLRETDQYIVSNCRNIFSRRLWFGALEYEKSLLTSEGSSVYSLIPRTRIVIFLSAEKDGKRAELRKIIGAGRQFEDTFGDGAALRSELDSLFEHLNNKLDGVFPDAGEWDCVLAPEMSGMLAHEAIGHTAEADSVLSGAVTRDKLGKQVASPIISLTDFAHTAFGAACPVPILADDEGAGASDVPIIRNGVLESYLHNRESAALMGGKACGNARAATFGDEPIIRMRNTAILPGKDSLEDMISSVDRGYLLLGSGDGQADSTGEFLFGVTIGYEIRSGRVGRAIKDTTISGLAYDVLNSAKTVSNRFEWLNGGMCSKPQMVTVGMGGPDILCRARLGGK